MYPRQRPVVGSDAVGTGGKSLASHGEIPAVAVHLHSGFTVFVAAGRKGSFQADVEAGAGGGNFDVGGR